MAPTLRRACCVGEQPQPTGPAAGRADGVADLLPALAVPIEVAVLELDARAIGALADEAHLDLARLLEIGLELPLRADVPADDEAVGRLVGEHARPAALAAVDAAVVDVAALAALEDHLRELPLEDVVLGRPPGPHLVGEDRERPLDRRVDDDRRPDGGRCCLRGHETSSACSTAALKAVRA